MPALTNKVNDFQPDETQLRSRKPTIGRVYSPLRDQDPEAYEPKLVSIGPLHHGKSNLLQMERKKKENLSFIAGPIIFNKTFGILIDEVFSCLHQASEQYKEKIEMSEDKFMEMLVIDGCFVIGVCLRFDPIKATSVPAEVHWDYALLWRDLMLLENQIPFFVLNMLYNKIAKSWYQIASPPSKEDYPDFVSLVLRVLRINLPRERYPKEEEVLHLLHLKHLSLDPCLIPDQCPKTFWRLWGIYDAFNAYKPRNGMVIPRANKLSEAGIRLQKIKIPKAYNKDFHLKVSFRDGTLEIPRLLVNHLTCHELRNLIAFEQCAMHRGIPRHFTDYCMFLENLINTVEDVRVLRRSGILYNLLGSDTMVAQLFNDLCRSIVFDFERHSYIELYREVAVFCEISRRTWHAYLMHNYFCNPCTIFFMMASILIPLLSSLYFLE